MKKLLPWAFLSLLSFFLSSCEEAENIVSVCVRGKIIDYNCGRNPVVQVLTPNIRIGIKTPVGDGTKEVENVVQVNNLPAQFNQLGTEFYFSFRLAKEQEKDTGICPAIYVPYQVPQLMVNEIWNQACPEDFDDD